MKKFTDTLDEIKQKCQVSINDPWHNLPCVLIPVKTINQIINGIEDCQAHIEKINRNDQDKETVCKCLHILEMYSQDVMSKPEAKVGDGITKNLAIIEAMKLIKKEFAI